MKQKLDREDLAKRIRSAARQLAKANFHLVPIEVDTKIRTGDLVLALDRLREAARLLRVSLISKEERRA